MLLSNDLFIKLVIKMNSFFSLIVLSFLSGFNVSNRNHYFRFFMFGLRINSHLVCLNQYIAQFILHLLKAEAKDRVELFVFRIFFQSFKDINHNLSIFEGINEDFLIQNRKCWACFTVAVSPEISFYFFSE